MVRICKITKNKFYILQFIDSVRLMASSLSNLVNNLSEGIVKLNVNMDTMSKNVKFAELDISIATLFLNTQTLKEI